MTGRPRWAMSPLDFCVHLVVPEGDHPPDVVLTVGCGLRLPISVTQHDQPPGPDHRLAGPAGHTVIAQEVCGD